MFCLELTFLDSTALDKREEFQANCHSRSIFRSPHHVARYSDLFCGCLHFDVYICPVCPVLQNSCWLKFSPARKAAYCTHASTSQTNFEHREANNPIGPLTSDAITCKSFGCATTLFAAAQGCKPRETRQYISYTSSEDQISKVRA